MRLRSFPSAVSAAIDAFWSAMTGKAEPTTLMPMPSNAQLCTDKAVMDAAAEVLRNLSLNIPMTDRDRLRSAANGIDNVRVVPMNYYHGLNIDEDEYPTVIRWTIDNWTHSEVALFVPRRNSNGLSSEFWAHEAQVALVNGAEPCEALDVLNWLAVRVQRGQVPATD